MVTASSTTTRRASTSTSDRTSTTSLFEPLEFQFFIRGLIAATLVGGLCGLLGVYIVLRRMSYIGHGLSHAVFGGAVVAYIISINFYIGASLWGFLAALLINAMTKAKSYIGADAAIGVVTTASFAIGIALISRYRTFTRSFDAALFGNILGISDSDLYAIVFVTIAAFVLILLLYRRLLFTTFDPEVAPFYGVSTAWVDAFFSLILAGAIVVSMRVMGVTLIAASIVIPPITARLITSDFARFMALSVVLGAACGFFGMYISYFVDVSSGANIVLTMAAVFVVVLLWSSIRGSPALNRATAASGRRLEEPLLD
jgi:manganese/iron transport system permease protein/iron/zinc/copper transport system permease protein